MNHPNNKHLDDREPSRVALKTLLWATAICWVAGTLLAVLVWWDDLDRSVGLVAMLTACIIYAIPFTVLVAEMIAWAATRISPHSSILATRLSLAMSLIVVFTIVGWILIAVA